jgi:hypothetical protein
MAAVARTLAPALTLRVRAYRVFEVLLLLGLRNSKVTGAKNFAPRNVTLVAREK